MNIFDRIKSKAQQAIQGVGNFIDQDKVTPGIQFSVGNVPVPGTGQNVSQRLQATQQHFAQNPSELNVFDQIANGNIQTGIKPLDVIGRFAGQYEKNWIADPLINIPGNVQTIGNEVNKAMTQPMTPSEKLGSAGKIGMAGVQTAGALFPGDEMIWATLNALKANAAKKDVAKAFTGEEMTGLGDALTGGQDNILATGGNIAELPIMLAAGGLKPKNVDNALEGAGKNSARITDILQSKQAKAVEDNLDFLPEHSKEISEDIGNLQATIKNHNLISQVDETVPPVDDLTAILREKTKELKEVNKEIEGITNVKPVKNEATMIAGEDGIIPLRKPVNSTSQLDEVLAQGKEVAQANQPKAPLDEILALPGGEKLPQLEAPKNLSVSIAQIRKIKEQGGDVSNLRFTAKNADEAREALKLGLGSNQIDMAGATLKPGKTLYGGDKGLTQELDQVKAALNTVGKGGGEVKKFSWLSSVLEPTRLLKRILPEEMFKLADEAFLTPLNKARGEAAAFKKQYQQVIQNLGSDFKVGSKISELTQKFGEGKLTEEALVKMVGQETAAKVINANATFRRMYDEILTVVNQKREAAGLEAIARRDDYYRHMGEMSDNWLSSLISGGSGQKSASIMKQRQGDKTTFDAVGGFLDYLEKAGRAGFTDTVVPNIKQMAQQLLQRGDSQAADYLNWYADSILGIRQDAGAAGNFLRNASARMRGSKVVGNISSLVNQMASFPTGINDAGWGNFIKGMVSGDAKNAVKQSAYLKDAGYRPSTSLYSGGKKVVREAGAVLQEADMAGKRAVWQGMYEKAKSMGVADPVAEADRMAEMVMGSRGIGSASKFQDSWFGQIIAPFTNEAQTQANRVIELVGEKKFATLLGIMVTNYAFNEVNQRYLTGNRVTFDPIQATLDAYEQWNGSDRKEANKVKAATRILAEGLQLSPVAQSIAVGSYQLAKMIDGENGNIPDSSEIFGSDDPTRMGSLSLYNPLPTGKRITGNKYADAALEVGAKQIPFGNQAIKTTQDLFSEGEGVVKSRSGKAMFETPKDLLNKARGLAFGQYATPDATEYFANDFSRPLTEKETKAYDQLPENQRTDFLKSKQESGRNVLRLTSATTAKTSAGKVPFLKPQTAEERKAVKDYVTTSLDGGAIPDKDSITEGLFSGYTAKDTSIENRNKVYTALNTAMNNEFYTDEQKQAVLAASGASPEDFSYYQLAAKDEGQRLQELLPKLEGMDTDQAVQFLMMGRRMVGGKQLVTSTMVDYLYEMDYITEDEKEAIKALRFDEPNNKFYFTKAFAKKGSGSGRELTYKQASALFKVTLPKFSTLKGVDSLLKSYQSSSQTDKSGDILIEEVLNKRPQTTKFKLKSRRK